jgi:GDP-L-fucose synthase
MQRVFVAGHHGMVGSAICRELSRQNSVEVITASRAHLDLTDQSAVRVFFDENNFDQIYLAAAKVGGIHANNSYPGEFIHQNLIIQANVIDSAYRTGTNRLLFLGSSCIYPKHANQPIIEEYLLTGELEPTNEPYAIAKIAGIKMCESYNRQYGTDFRAVMPTNLYGPGDNYHGENSHVIPALIKKFHEATEHGGSVEIWGSGNPFREFLFVDDLAKACIHVMNQDSFSFSFVNVGSNEEVSIRELSMLIADLTGFTGDIVFNQNYPDGTPRKALDSSKIISLGWTAKTSLSEGLEVTYRDFLSRKAEVYA